MDNPHKYKNGDNVTITSQYGAVGYCDKCRYALNIVGGRATYLNGEHLCDGCFQQEVTHLETLKRLKILEEEQGKEQGE